MAPDAALGQEAAAAAPAPAAQPGAKTATVTLVTGDTVYLTTNPDGRQTAAVKLGPASGHGNFQTVERDGHLYVYPDVAVPYLRGGRLDDHLFDVTELAGRYPGDLPLILEYQGNAANLKATGSLLAQPVPNGARKVRDLASVASVAVRVPGAKSAGFWESIDDDRPAAAVIAAPNLGRRLKKVWLDEKVTASLDVSVPQIGAPTAWQAGYDGTGTTVAVLDTGIDPTHPDFAGRVAEMKNFSTAADAVDHHGHGTHVASTIAGSGAASGGKYKGVAPGAKLLVGKVLDDSGSGNDSGVIAGMEWAAAHAKVVSMSLGGGPTDGTDPMARAVNRLSDQYGTLFVIAAGNAGPTAGTVASPGTADRALTVAAVTKADEMAGFSSRGPRFGDRALKPEIAAPGVNIAAARAAGTFPTIPAGDRYVGLSGTSMATPHVAGAAILVAQQHPAWTGERIKENLTSTAKVLATPTVWDQGAGRLDLTREVTQKVDASTGALSFGQYTGPYGNVEPARRTVTYRNDGDAPVTLDLTVSAKTGTTPAPAGMLSVSPSGVTVPAHGTADATVTLDPDTGDLGLYSGRLQATGTDGRTSVTTAIGYEKELLNTLTVNATGKDGRPSADTRLYVWNLDTNVGQSRFMNTPTATLQLRPGQYFVYAAVATMDQPNKTAIEYTAFARPQFTVSGDTPLNLDARGAKPVTVNVAKPTRTVLASHGVYRMVDKRAVSIGTGTGVKLSVVPSEPATRGTFEYYSRFALEAPLITMRIAKPDIALHPEYLTPDGQLPKRLDGHRSLPAVYVGAGRAGDYDGRDVRGKVALVRSTAGLSIEDQVAAAADAKAAFVAVLSSEPGVFQPFVKASAALPVVGLSKTEGDDLVRRLGQGAVSLTLDGTSFSPYRYDLVLPYPQVPDGISYTADGSNTALEHNKVYAVAPNQIGAYTHAVFRPYDFAALSLVYEARFPYQQDQYYTAGDTRYSNTVYASFPSELMANMLATFTPGQELTRTYYKAPMHPGSSAVRPPPSRTGDKFLFTWDSFTDSEPDHTTSYNGEQTAARIYRDGELVAQNRYAVGYFDVGVEKPATYRVELDVAKGRPGMELSTEERSAWTFTSARPAGTRTVNLPTLTASWDLNLDLNNSAAAGRDFPLTLLTGTQPGAQPVPVKDIKVWASYDDGGTWTKVSVSGAGNGRYAGLVKHPKLRDTTGYVALRIEVTDRDGSKLEQTVMQAYKLK